MAIKEEIAAALEQANGDYNAVDWSRWFRIRKLTPRECWRLMFSNSDNTKCSDTDFEKAESVVSNTQLYKQAGNSICTVCLEAIFRELM